MTKILVDSTADLGRGVAEKYQIEVIPLTVVLRENTYKDGVDIQLQGLFRKVEEFGELPKTSAPSVMEYVQFFSRYDDVLYLGISSKLSASMQNAYLAKGQIDGKRVYLVDTLNLSTGIGLLALKAVEMRDAGIAAEEIVLKIQVLIPKVHTSFVIDTLEYLYMGGRCSGMQNLMSSLLQIRPVITVRSDGTLGVKEKIRGTRKKALDSMLKDLDKHQDVLDRSRVFITHTGCDADAQYLAEQITAMVNPDEVLITLAGSVIASHCGPNTIGILYLEK